MQRPLSAAASIASSLIPISVEEQRKKKVKRDKNWKRMLSLVSNAMLVKYNGNLRRVYFLFSFPCCLLTFYFLLLKKKKQERKKSKEKSIIQCGKWELRVLIKKLSRPMWNNFILNWMIPARVRAHSRHVRFTFAQKRTCDFISASRFEHRNRALRTNSVQHLIYCQQRKLTACRKIKHTRNKWTHDEKQ